MAKASKNDQVRCPHCGATDISLDTKSGKLKCNFCRGLFDGEATNAAGGVKGLTTHEIGGGAEDIIRRSDERALPLVSSRAVD